MTLTRAVVLSLAAAAMVAVAVGLIEVASSRRAVQPPVKLTVAQMRQRLARAPAQLAALHAQASQVLDGGGAALHARLRALHGYPVVINKWASWCGPCRAELGALQRASLDLGRRVAFLGLDSVEADRASAVAFLRSLPVSYPSYYDRTGRLGQEVTESPFTPVTVFIAPGGRRYIHQGPYPSSAKLERDVERYALHG